MRLNFFKEIPGRDQNQSRLRVDFWSAGSNPKPRQTPSFLEVLKLLDRVQAVKEEVTACRTKYFLSISEQELLRFAFVPMTGCLYEALWSEEGGHTICLIMCHALTYLPTHSITHHSVSHSLHSLTFLLLQSASSASEDDSSREASAERSAEEERL